MTKYEFMCLFVLLSVSIGKAAVTMDKSRQIRSSEDSKIVEGKEAKAKWYLYTVAINNYDARFPLDTLFRCAANLFHLKFAVTNCKCATKYEDYSTIPWFKRKYRPIPLTDKELQNLYGWAGTYTLWNKNENTHIRNISKAYHHPKCELMIGHSMNPDIWMVYDLAVFEFSEEFVLWYQKVRLAPRLDKVRPYKWWEQEFRLTLRGIDVASCYVAGWGATWAHERYAEEYCCYARSLKHASVVLKHEDFCASANCIRLIREGEEQLIPNCYKKSMRLYKSSGVRCGVFAGSYGNIGPGDFGGPVSCKVYGKRYFVGVLSQTHPGIDSVTFYYVPMTILYPYLNGILANYTKQLQSSSISHEFNVKLAPRVFIPSILHFLLAMYPVSWN